MSRAPLIEARFGRSMKARRHDAEAQRPAARGFWRDLCRDWCLWSGSERAIAIVLLIVLATMPTLLLIATYVHAAA
jgi:hypothetical protein